MNYSSKKKIALWIGVLGLVCALAQTSAFGASISFTNSVTINASHTLTALVGLGASSNYADTATASLPMFNKNLGGLTGMQITVNTKNPTFTGQINFALANVNLAYSQTQQAKFILSTLNLTNLGASVGPSGQLLSLNIGNTQATISTNAATIASSMSSSNLTQLLDFCTNNGRSYFTVNTEVDSFYNLGLVSALSTLQGTGTYPIEVVVTYTYSTSPTLGSLSQKSNGGGLVLSYPATFSGYTFETTTNLVTPSWSAISNGIVTTNGLFTLTIPETLPQQFFRLHVIQ